jgi:hypothetical protein
MATRFVLLLLFCCALFAGCGGDSGTHTPPPSAPRIVDLKSDPAVICVGSASEVTFTVIDASQPTISWNATLSTTIHGTMEPASGTAASGSVINTRFKAAKSGRHQHKVVLTLHAKDSGGMEAEPVAIELFVFNCG